LDRYQGGGIDGVDANHPHLRYEPGRRSMVKVNQEHTADVRVVVDGREVQLTNLDKVLWPRASFTKRQLIEYYVELAPILLPHLDARPRTPDASPTASTASAGTRTNAGGSRIRFPSSRRRP
jgi:hypothetical protein